MNDPRNSGDPVLRAAISTWDNASPYRDDLLSVATQLCCELRYSKSHEAFAWASLACGRMTESREQIDKAEVMLAEALGRFGLIGNRYGEELSYACMALLHLHRRNMDRALELAVKPFGSGVAFRSGDQIFLHNTAAQCYSERNEWHSGLGHLIKGYEIANANGLVASTIRLLTNIGYVLLMVGEDDLAAKVFKEALKAADANAVLSGQAPDPNLLSNLALVHCYLGKYAEALTYGTRLFNQIDGTDAPNAWIFYESLADTFAFNGKIVEAEQCLGRSKQLKEGKTPNNYTDAITLISEAVLLEAKGDFGGAIAIGRKVLENVTPMESPPVLRSSARLLARCHRAAGEAPQAAKWTRYAEEVGRDRILGPILLMRIRSSLSLEKPNNPLTNMELTCLSLSARGQSSADIALKLGIKKRTVNFHFTNVLRKLNAINRQEAIAKAIHADILRSG